MKKHNLIYKITNTVNNKIYIGCHQTDILEDGYFGSGTILKRSFEKYGIDKFTKEILYDFETSDEMFLMELNIVDGEFVKRKDTYNIKIGGQGGWGHLKGTITVKDEYGNTSRVALDNPDFVSGKLVSFSKNMLNVRDKDGIIYYVKDDDPRYLSGELVSIFNVKDENNNMFIVSKNDPKYLSGELVPIWTGLKHSDETKRKISEKNSENHKGKCNSQYGKCWIHNLELKQSKSVLKTELEHWFNLGWIKGRKLKFF